MANEYVSKVVLSNDTTLIDPDAVQAKINWVINTAQAIKNGQPWAKEHYGNDENEKKHLVLGILQCKNKSMYCMEQTNGN